VAGGKGLVGLAEAWHSWLSAWEDLRIGVDVYRELDNERVLVLVHKSGRGKQSGLEIGQMHAKAASVCHVRGGKVTRLVLYYDVRTRSPISASLRRRALRGHSPFATAGCRCWPLLFRANSSSA
jgi:hypothetical protein